MNTTFIAFGLKAGDATLLSWLAFGRNGFHPVRLCELLYQRKWCLWPFIARPQPEDRVLDLFCGLGNFTFCCWRPAPRHSVVGVEGGSGAARGKGKPHCTMGWQTEPHGADSTKLFDGNLKHTWRIHQDADRPTQVRRVGTGEQNDGLQTSANCVCVLVTRQLLARDAGEWANRAISEARACCDGYVPAYHPCRIHRSFRTWKVSAFHSMNCCFDELGFYGEPQRTGPVSKTAA